MLKLASGSYKGYPFLFQYETKTELKLLILQFQNTVDFVFCDVLHEYTRHVKDNEPIRKVVIIREI